LGKAGEFSAYLISLALTILGQKRSQDEKQEAPEQVGGSGAAEKSWEEEDKVLEKYM
jgi:hypothetical protein